MFMRYFPFLLLEAGKEAAQLHTQPLRSRDGGRAAATTHTRVYAHTLIDQLALLLKNTTTPDQGL